MKNNETYYTISQIAEILGIQKDSLNYYIYTTKTLIPCGKNGVALKFKKEHVDTFIQNYRKLDAMTIREAAECLTTLRPLRQRSAAQWRHWLNHRIRYKRTLPKPAPTVEFWNCIQVELDEESYLFPEEKVTTS